MKKTPVPETPTEDDLLPEYQFDYARAKPNRFAGGRPERHTVALDADVAEVFTTSESVNIMLRALITSMPKSPKSGARSKQAKH